MTGAVHTKCSFKHTVGQLHWIYFHISAIRIS